MNRFLLFYGYFSVLFLIFFNTVSYENKYLAIGRTALVVCNHMQLVQHILIYSNG